MLCFALGHFILGRSQVLPSEELQQMVFPNVDYWINRFDKKDRTQEDWVGPKFLNN